MDKIKYLLQILLPKPNIPQKRYLIMFFMVLYGALKLYVSYTPDKYDDVLLEQAHAVVIDMLTHYQAVK